jgi:hypothetical protein
MGIEPTIPVFERAKIFHALDGAATVIGYLTVLRVSTLSFSPQTSILVPDYACALASVSMKRNRILGLSVSLQVTI